MNGRISLSDDTNLILGDGFTLDVKGIYIPRGSTLTIYGQNAGTGRICSHPSGGAAIGGGKRNKADGTVTINGGVINATGSYGIGSGEEGDDVDITLNYTDVTRDSVSITASSFSGTVTLNQPFQNWNGVRLYLPGEQPVEKITKYMHGDPLVAWDREINSWERLQFAIDVAEDGSTIKLTENIKASSNNDDTALMIPDGKSITIDVCGSTINRNLSIGNLRNDGCVIINYGSLTIEDSGGGGKITGGYNANLNKPLILHGFHGIFYKEVYNL